MRRTVAGLLLALTLVSCARRATAPPERPVPVRTVVADSTESEGGCCSDLELAGIVAAIAAGIAVSGLVSGGS